ncbi:hypothetical protein D3C76_1341350 [compost metagenome]
MDDANACRFHLRHVFDGFVAGGFDDRHAILDDRIDVLVVRRRADGRENGHVDPERVVGHLPATTDFLGQRFRGRLGKPGQHAQAPSVGDGRGEFGATYPLHAALHDRITDAKHFGNTCFHNDCLVHLTLRSSRPRARPMISFMISLAPAKIRDTRASRYIREMRYSSM